MRTLTPIVACTWLLMFLPGGPVQAKNLVSNIAIHIDRQDNPASTPIAQQYLALIGSADEGDEIILLQKYFRNKKLNKAVINAAERGVKVLGIYGKISSPVCEDLLPPQSSVDCSQIFVQNHHVHHKSMVLHRSNGNTTAIIGSFNLRERDGASPRAHTVLSFDIEADNTFFSFYKAHADSLGSSRSETGSVLSLATKNGGRVLFNFHPAKTNLVEELLRDLSQCDGPVWLSYYHAQVDSIGVPVFRQLQKLVERGCDVRFLLDQHADNQAAAKHLQSLGINMHYPDEGDGNVTLGHKIVMLRSGGRLHLIQSSANLANTDHNLQHNLSVYLSGVYPVIEQALNQELSRYW